MGTDESRFNVSSIVMDKVTRPCPQTTTFEEKGEPKRYRTEVLPITSLRLTARPNWLSDVQATIQQAFIPPTIPPIDVNTPHTATEALKAGGL